MYDVTIIGAGPAGVSASLYTKRANLKTLILYQEASALEKTEHIANYYGFSKGITGKQLYKEGIKQAENLGVIVNKEEVITIQMMENEFKIITENNQYETRSIILATGNKRNKLDIKGIEEFEGKGVSYCAICDGFFYKNKRISVIGHGNYAISEVNELINLADTVTILTNGEKAPEVRIDDNDSIEVNTKEIEGIQGDKKVEEIKFKDGTTLKTDGIFVAQGVAGSMEFAKRLGIVIRKR